MEVARGLAPHDFREMAIPSYSHWNPLIRRLFWQRLDAVWACGSVQRGQHVFEFGVGSGVLLPSHHSRTDRVTATDLHTGPARRLDLSFGSHTEFIELGDLMEWAFSHTGQVDRLFAIDVLDHLSESELVETLAAFRTMRSRAARLVVCGPTETCMYQIGRWVAGFKNEYHHRNVFDVHRHLERDWLRVRWLRLPSWPLPAAFCVGAYEPRRD